jgi:hypothetical protein
LGVHADAEGSLVGKDEDLAPNAEGRFVAPCFHIDPIGFGQASRDLLEPSHIVHI